MDRCTRIGARPRHRIELVRGEHERRRRPLGDLQGLDRLWLEAVVDVDDEDRDVGERAAARAQRRKRVVAGRVDE